MSTALGVYHGPFGRVALYHLNRPMTTHAHREGHLTFLVSGQDSAMVVRDKARALDHGFAVACSPWEPHNFLPGDAENGSLFLVLYIKPIWFLEVARSVHAGLRFGGNVIEITPHIHRWVHRISGLLLEGETTDLFDGYLYELTQECFDQSWQWSETADPLLMQTSSFSDFRVRKSIKLMREQLGNDFLLDEIAREAGLSRPHFFKLFRRQTGITPNLYLNTLRMEKAIDDLTIGNRTVTDIGFDLGFSSQASFTRFFCSNVGIAPTDYRRVAHVGSA